MPAILFKQLTGQVVSRIVQTDSGAIAIQFETGSALIVLRDGDGIAGHLEKSKQARSGAVDSGPRPTARQREYLEFIKRYTLRYGVSPAESDIQRHFMVSAPSINQMVRTLERRGFISRGRGFSGQALPRSIRVVLDDF